MRNYFCSEKYRKIVEADSISDLLFFCVFTFISGHFHIAFCLSYSVEASRIVCFRKTE